MASLGSDLADVINELGDKITVHKHPTISGETYEEYVDSDFSMDERTPFKSAFMIRGTFPYDTNAVPGDRVDFEDATNKEHLLVVLKDQLFERECITKEGVLYRCNTKVHFKRRDSEPTRNDNYELVRGWSTVFSGEYGLFTGDINDQKISEEDYARFNIANWMLFVSDDLDGREEDRCIIGIQNYKVQKVNSHRLPGVKICELVEDTRE